MPDSKSKIDELKNSLYRRGQGTRKPRPWSRFTKKESDVHRDWQHKHEPISYVKTKREDKKGMGFPMKLFVFSVIFFIISLTIAAFIISRGSNIVSSDKIDIAVSGPVLIGGGELLSLQIDIANRNNATLESVDLIIEFPEGTRDGREENQELQRIRESLGNLAPGELTSQIISVRLFGEENTKREISIGIEYRVADSNAIFFKEKVFEVQIGTSPISLLVSMPTEVNSGKDIELVVEVVSNAKEVIEDVVLSVEYPFGFLFSKGTPSPDVGNVLWNLGDLEPQDRRTINIVGKIEGQNDEERTFRFTGGLLSSGAKREIGTVLLVVKRTLAIRRPFLQVDLTLDRSADDVHIAASARTVFANINWQNNITVPVEDVVVIAEFAGDVLDEKSVRVLNGFYRSIDNSIIWDKTRVPALARLEPGASGNLSFEFSSLEPKVSLFKNGKLDVSVTISGARIGDTPETTGEVSSDVLKTVQFSSVVDVFSRAVYSTGPFTNVGPMPPVVDQETTYTVIWSITNASNDLADVKVSAALPSYVNWVGTVSPSSESVTFNSIGSEILWEIGSLPSGVGYTSPPREVSFQIQFLPSVSQLNTSPVLMGLSTLRGHDTFTDTTVSDTSREVTIEITTDPLHRVGDGRVTE